MPLHPGSIGETFAMLMAKCITSFSLGDGLEGHFQAIFQIFSTIIVHELGSASVDLRLQIEHEHVIEGHVVSITSEDNHVVAEHNAGVAISCSWSSSFHVAERNFFS